MQSSTVFKAVIFIMTIMFYNAANGCVLSVAYNQDPPYHSVDEKGVVIGSDSDLLKVTLDEIGCSYEFRDIPWARALYQLEHGEADIAIGAGFKSQRAKWAYYSVPYKNIDHHLVSNKVNNQKNNSIADFMAAGNTLAIVIGWAYPVEIFEQVSNKNYASQITKVSEYEQLPLMLKSGRVDGVISTKSQLENNGINFDSVDILATYGEDLHYLFSKKSVDPGRVTEFNNVLYEKIYSGERATIFKHYN